MQLFYCPEIKTKPVLSEEESRHAIKVLRKNIGDTIEIIDGKGGFYKASISNDNFKKCEFEIIEEVQNHQPLPYHLQIAIAPTKNNDRLEWFLEKATEIGITEITPILCEHSERKVIKEDRLEKVLISAMKQSGQAFLPKLNSLTSFNEVITLTDSEKYIAHCEEGLKVHFKNAYQKGKSTLVLIGPEGDFSSTEIELALKNNFKPISLGENRLRTETAGIMACSIVNTLEV